MSAQNNLIIENESKKVCVTGGTGFIAAHIIQMLLKDGYTVNATVRNAKDESKLKWLKDLDKNNHLHFFSADLTTEGSYDEAVSGCEYVIHAASPYVLDAKNPQKELVEPAVQGTLTVLKSCSKAKVKKVVLTSSMAAITDSPDNDHVYTEADWNTESSLTRNPYYFSKKLAEEAWKYVKEHPDFDLVVINPFMVIGPEVNPTGINTSNKIFVDLLTGKMPAILSLGWGFVDVRDVAKSHIIAMTKKEAEGRYLVCNETVAMEDLVAKLKEKYPGYKYPSAKLNCSIGDALIKFSSHFQESGTGSYLRTNIGKFPKYNHSKVQKLGLEFTPIDKTIYDTVDDIIARGLAHK